MTSANDIIGYLAQRGRRNLRPESLQLPPSWGQWLERPAGVGADGIDPAQLTAAIAARPLRPAPRAPAALSGWQAWRRLFWQGWEAADTDQRGLRWGSRVADVLLHAVLIAALLWLMVVRFMSPPAPAERDDAVQVEFIGQGHREEGGGAPSQEAAASAAAAPAAPASAAASASPATQPAPAETVGEAASPLPPPEPLATPQPVVPAAQPLQVTEVAIPEPDSFQVPPPRERSVQTPTVELRVPERRAEVEEVPVLAPQPVRSLQPRSPVVAVRDPQLRRQIEDIPAPQAMPQVAARATPQAASATAQVRVPGTRAGIAEIPMPASGSAPGQTTADGDGSARQGASASPGNATQPANGGRGIAQTGSGAGPSRTPAPGGWPGAAKSDDWGASSRNRPGTGAGSGQRPGLLGDDGRARLPDVWSEQSVVDFDRAGQWLKRPGLEYRGTRFDEIWIPGGSLLEEWVRRGIRQMRIPIPGSKRHLECVVSVLQLGGGCYPVNPDANEQPARARKPPDIPFKPELQEDNGSLPPRP